MDEAHGMDFLGLLKAFHQADEAGDVKAAEAIGMQCLLTAAQQSAATPNEHLRLEAEAYEHEDAARWGQAEAVRRHILALAEAEGHPANVFKAHEELSRLYAVRGMADEALAEAEAAVTAAQRTGMVPVLAPALEGLAQCCLTVGNSAAASETADRLVQITTPTQRDRLLGARALVMRARCRVERGEIGQAQEDLEAAWRTLAPRADALMFAGFQSGLARWWEVSARIRTENNDAAGAADALGRAVEFRRTVSRLPQLGGPYKHHALAKTLYGYAVALPAAGEHEAADRAFRESCHILSTIGLPPYADPVRQEP